jgi:beta-exotoxin I transport system ATP-binding protein
VNAIEIDGVSRRFKEVWALRDLSLSVERGEVFAFLGPNGAGKSTTIRILLNMIRPSSGRVSVLGLDPAARDVDVHRRVGYLPGDLALFPRVSGRRHLRALARLRGGVDDATLDALVARFDAELDRPVRELSKGNRQKIGVVAAFMARPELLILDEPTSGLDPLMRNAFLDLVRETAREGRTVFLSSHDLDEVQRVADRVALVRGGELVTVDSIESLSRRLPQRVDVRLGRPAASGDLADVPGATVLNQRDREIQVALAGEPGPLLRALVALEPVEVTWRRADLEETFLELYGEGHHDAH